MLVHNATCRVIYGDTDKMGMAYHANYFRWFEIGRTEMFRRLGLSYRDIEEKGLYLPVSTAHCKFIAPARYDDTLTIETTLDTKVRGGMKFDYRLLRKGPDDLLATGYTKHACVDHDGRVVRPPTFIKALIDDHT